MHEVAPGVFHLPLLGRSAVNATYADGVLFDTGLESSAKTILGALQKLPLDAVALTHGHVDHVGSAAAVCAARGVPLWCPEGDADAVASGDLLSLSPPSTLMRLMKPSAPPAPVARRLRGGDTVAGFVVLETPGHSPGHVAYWRERDRVLILGDVLTNMQIPTTIAGLHEPPRLFTVDPAQNRASAHALRRLDPAVVLFGHGAPLRDTARFHAFIDRLPTS